VSITRTSAVGGVTEGNAGQSLHTFNVTLSAAATVATTVTWTITPTAPLTAGDFVGALTGTTTIAVGQTTVPLSIAVAGDTAVETDETFTVALTNPVNARLGTASATSIILNDDIPTVSIARTSAASVLEGATNNAAAASSHTFTVSLSAATSVATTVTWALSLAGTVDAADFFGATGGTVTIPAGQTSAVVTVGVRGDATSEANETFTVTLSSPVGATLGTATATATIQNDDGATPPPPPPGPPQPSTITGDNAANNMMGTDGDNTINLMGGNDIVNAMGGHDSVMGGTGNDSLIGGAGNDSLVGEAGNDTLVGDAGADVLTGGAGADRLTGGADADVFRYVARADSTTAAGGRDTITDFQTGVDKIDLSTLDANESVAGVQSFTFIGGANFTALGQARFAGGQLQLNTTGNTGADFVVAVTGTVVAGDLILSNVTPAPLAVAPAAAPAPAPAAAPAPAPAATPGVTFRGQNNADTYTGTAGDDTIDVRGGNDVVIGLAGNDSIVGGTGNDNLNGGAEADAFVFLAIGDSTAAVGGRDTITDFESGVDKIDLSAIDANASLAGLQDFTFIGADAFTGLGQVRFANGLLEANTTGDAGADFSITVQGSSVIAADVIL
jgi:serralysin